MDNVFEGPDGLVIFNGGNPLPGCPKSFVEARAWEDQVNEGKGQFHEPRWKFDCGFKLDFDGPLLDVSSRFYPPKTHYGKKWDGTVTIMLLGRKILEKEFEEDSLDELKVQVEKYIKTVATQLVIQA